MTSTHTTQLTLASASPRRCELLQQIELDFHVHVVEIDETPLSGESPSNYVERIALSKAKAAYTNLRGEHKKFGFLVVLAADTSVICDTEILGKPLDKENARQQLKMLSGRTHEVLTAVAVAAADEGVLEARVQSVVSRSTVEFAILSDGLIEAYLQTDEPYDKAGSYAVQGLAAQFIKRIDGSYSGIMGLPLFETAQLLKPFDIHTFVL